MDALSIFGVHLNELAIMSRQVGGTGAFMLERPSLRNPQHDLGVTRPPIHHPNIARHGNDSEPEFLALGGRSLLLRNQMYAVIRGELRAAGDKTGAALGLVPDTMFNGDLGWAHVSQSGASF